MLKTKSERTFERFLADNNLPIWKITEDGNPTPDYRVPLSGIELIFEVKELQKEDNFTMEEGSRTVGEHIRKRIHAERTRRQTQSAATRGLPAVLLIYNNLDPIQRFGTEDEDFRHAMYGEHTVLMGVDTRKITASFYGENKSFQRDKNTSFSALGRLMEHRQSVSVTLFENMFAKVKIDYDALPQCFDVVRFNRQTAVLGGA